MILRKMMDENQIEGNKKTVRKNSNIRKIGDEGMKRKMRAGEMKR